MTTVQQRRTAIKTLASELLQLATALQEDSSESDSMAFSTEELQSMLSELITALIILCFICAKSMGVDPAAIVRTLNGRFQ